MRSIWTLTSGEDIKVSAIQSMLENGWSLESVSKLTGGYELVFVKELTVQ